MTAYYNEIDPYAAQWLRNLISNNLIPHGEVDERSIVDVQPGDLAAALHNCIKLAYNRDQDELPSAIITTASKAVAKYDMLVDFSAAMDD